MQPNDPSRSQPAGYPQPNTLSTSATPGVRAVSIPREGFLTAAFVWMFVGLLVSAGSAAFVMNNAAR